jgi:Carbohydrate-selective porin, OprB family/S-layer homology domain
MSKLFWNLTKVTPAVLGASLLAASVSVAQTTQGNGSTKSVDTTLEQIEQYNQQAPAVPMGQVTNVNQLRDVAPTDWAFEALQSLVERYGCIAGFPNQTYRGSKALTRYEFAAGLNACLNQIERLIASSESVMREDLDKITRLSEEFQAELATLGTRVDNLEGRTAFLEDRQFSTTTKLKGKVIFGLSGSFAQDDKAVAANGGNPTQNQNDDQITFSNRVRLNFETSFKGKDVLRTRLQATNVPNLGASTGVNAARLGYEGTDQTNDIVLDDLWYRFPFGDKITAWVGANSLSLDDVFDTTNPFFESNETGTVTRFARYNPLVYRGTDGAGAALKYEFNKQFNLTATYLSDSTVNNPSNNNGLLNGAYTGAAQLGFSPNENIKLSVTYARSHQPIRNNANSAFNGLTSSTGDSTIDSFFNVNNATGAVNADRFGVQASWKITDRINIAGWGGYATAEAARDGRDIDFYTAALNVAVLDIGKEGSVIGLTVGLPPFADRDDEDIPIFVEGLYKYPVTDKISLTPSVYAIFNPNSNSENDTVLVGTLRTTFEF